MTTIFFFCCVGAGRKDEGARHRAFSLARQFIEKAHGINAQNQCVEAYYKTILQQTRLI